MAQIVKSGPQGGRPRRVTKIATKVPAPPKKTGPKKRRRYDVSVPPDYILAMKQGAKKIGIPEFEWHRLAVAAYAKELLVRPIDPRPRACPACLRDFHAPRTQGDYKRLRVAMNFDADSAAYLEWIADTFYLGTWSQAFEAAVAFFLGPDAPQPRARI